MSTGTPKIPVALAWTIGATLCVAFVGGAGMAAKILERTEGMSRGFDRFEAQLQRVEVTVHDLERTLNAKLADYERRISLIEARREK